MARKTNPETETLKEGIFRRRLKRAFPRKFTTAGTLFSATAHEINRLRLVQSFV